MQNLNCRSLMIAGRICLSQKRNIFTMHGMKTSQLKSGAMDRFVCFSPYRYCNEEEYVCD